MPAAHRSRYLVAVLVMVVMTACYCAQSHDGTDAGDGVDAGRDGGGEGRADGGDDGGRGDSGSVDGGPPEFPAGWEWVPSMPRFCNAWRPRDVRRAVRPLRFEGCEPAVAGCEELVIEWRRGPDDRNNLSATIGLQTWGDSNVIAVGIPYYGAMGNFYDDSIYTVEGEPVAVWRLRWPTADGGPSCDMSAVALAAEEVATAFTFSPALDDVTPGYLIGFIVGQLDEVQTAEITRTVTDEQIGSRGNAPSELLYDGDNLIMQGALGAIYLGWMGGRPFDHLASGRTGDSGNTSGMLWEGAFYWAGSPYGEAGWQRIRPPRKRDDQRHVHASRAGRAG